MTCSRNRHQGPRARDTRRELAAAIKVQPVELADDGERLRRFEREAKRTASTTTASSAIWTRRDSP